MKRIDFVNELSTRLEIKRRDLIEKDLILHFILLNLSKDKFFSENFAFKGGTCLIKCFYGYIRFSEDIDFTWRS
ncbi:MAG: nucleotidyl transferase AbiEii/AbiGii toxin family protein, partial [Rhabdochlamydiaceae bacterium]